MHLAFIRLAIATIAVFPVIACFAAPERFDWRPECVGRMQISLPGDAEVGARTAASWQAERSNSNTPMRFSDEALAGWSHQTMFWVTHALPKAELETLYRHDVWTAATFAAKLKQYPDFPFDRHSFRTHPVAPLNGTAWSYGIRNLSYTYRQEIPSSTPTSLSP